MQELDNKIIKRFENRYIFQGFIFYLANLLSIGFRKKKI